MKKKLIEFLKRLDEAFVRSIPNKKRAISILYYLIFAFLFSGVAVSFTEWTRLTYALILGEVISMFIWLRLMFVQNHVFLVEKGPKGHPYMMHGKIVVIEARVDPVGVATVIAPKEFSARWKQIDVHGPRADWVECEGPARFLTAQEYTVLINSIKEEDKPQN